MYEELSRFYDELMSDVDYDTWAHRVIDVIKREMPSARQGLDLACGSGNFTVRLATGGYHMIGADPSAEMLTIAQQKSKGLPVSYVCQSANTLSLTHQVDFITMMCDGANYCTEGVQFDKLAAALVSGGVFVFDVSGFQYLSQTLGNQLYFEDNDDLSYFWQNEYDEQTHRLHLSLTFFQLGTDGRYDRFDEEQEMRAYTVEEILVALSPFFEVRVCGEDLSGEGRDDSRRVHFICKKR